MTTPTPPTTTTPPTTIAAVPAPRFLWLTDRSRHKTGLSRCPRQRYLGYHAGPTGYGMTARRDSLPLVTGISVHRGLELLAEILFREDRLSTLDETRAIIATITAEYIQRVDARGYRGILAGPHTDETIKEQATLISGLLWALRLKFLPWLHATYQVVLVEQERLHFLDCSCGANPHDDAEHLRRDCAGKAIMIRTDLLARRRQGGSLAYFECKTTGWESDAWAEQWETDAQLALGTVDVEARVGAEVTELYIVALSKGRRQKDRYAVAAGGEADERKKQSSPLCYGYKRPGNPPLAPDDWLPAYEWVNEHGEIKRATRAHRKAGVWTLGESDWPVWQAYATANPGLTHEEFWVRMLPESVLDRICFVLGPMNRQDQQLQALLTSFRGDEERWQATLWRLYEAQAAGWTWATPEFQRLLDELIPCSWNCRPYGREHQCEFVPICHRHDGWHDPIGSGHYQPRLPHHDPELRQAIARGLLPAEAAATDDEE